VNANAEQLGPRLRFLEADPDNAGLLAECADLALALGRAEQSAALAERALARDPRDPYFRSRLANAKLAGGDTEAAVRLFQELLESGETAPELRYNLGYACLLAGRYEEAKSALEPLAREGRDVPGAALLLARAHHYLGDLDAAIALARSYEQSHPGDAHACAQLAMLHFDAADLDYGSIDREALAGRPAPTPTRPRAEAASTGPSTVAVAARLQEIWAELLRTGAIDPDTNFFEAGGDSVRLVQLHRAIRERLGRELSIVELLRNPTVRAQAQLLGEGPPTPAAMAATRSPAARRQEIERQRARRSTKP